MSNLFYLLPKKDKSPVTKEQQMLFDIVSRTNEQLRLFTIAAEHDFDCRCEACEAWLAVEEENDVA